VHTARPERLSAALVVALIVSLACHAWIAPSNQPIVLGKRSPVLGAATTPAGHIVGKRDRSGAFGPVDRVGVLCSLQALEVGAALCLPVFEGRRSQFRRVPLGSRPPPRAL
jgi:hypothetical protein